MNLGNLGSALSIGGFKQPTGYDYNPEKNTGMLGDYGLTLAPENQPKGGTPQQMPGTGLLGGEQLKLDTKGLEAPTVNQGQSGFGKFLGAAGGLLGDKGGGQQQQQAPAVNAGSVDSTRLARGDDVSQWGAKNSKEGLEKIGTVIGAIAKFYTGGM